MLAKITLLDRDITVDLSQPLDLSVPVRKDSGVRAWYLGAPEFSPVTDGDFIGSVEEGSSTNFFNITFNPHAHGTHTECLGHITHERESVNGVLTRYFFFSVLWTVTPEVQGDDRMITRAMLEAKSRSGIPEAIILRTLPNDEVKKTANYSHANPPYLEEAAAQYLREQGVQHLLVDLPSVDREKDEGRLLAHKAFWDIPKAPRTSATITELIYVPNHVEDGYYLLELQLPSMENDAVPSRPVLYQIKTI